MRVALMGKRATSCFPSHSIVWTPPPTTPLCHDLIHRPRYGPFPHPTLLPQKMVRAVAVVVSTLLLCGVEAFIPQVSPSVATLSFDNSSSSMLISMLSIHTQAPLVSNTPSRNRHSSSTR